MPRAGAPARCGARTAAKPSAPNERCSSAHWSCQFSVVCRVLLTTPRTCKDPIEKLRSKPTQSDPSRAARLLPSASSASKGGRDGALMRVQDLRQDDPPEGKGDVARLGGPDPLLARAPR